MDEMPTIRIGDREREQVVDLLKRAWADGRLTMDEFNERTEEAWAARTRDDLDILVETATSAAVVEALRSLPLTETVASGLRGATLARAQRKEALVCGLDMEAIASAALFDKGLQVCLGLSVISSVCVRETALHQRVEVLGLRVQCLGVVLDGQVQVAVRCVDESKSVVQVGQVVAIPHVHDAQS